VTSTTKRDGTSSDPPLDAGIDFIDTADVYGDGRSEKHIAHVLDEREARDDVVVATKAGRRPRRAHR